MAYEDLRLLVMLLSKKANSNLLSGNLSNLSAVFPLCCFVLCVCFVCCVLFCSVLNGYGTY